MFYIRAIPIAPYISSRDYLMAATFVYLRGKERNKEGNWREVVVLKSFL